MRASGIAVLLVALVGGCRREGWTSRPAEDSGAHSLAADGVSEESAKTDQLPEESAVPYVARLRSALVASDREAFARMLTYPVRVNTRSRCTVLTEDAKTLVSYFDPIVRGRVEASILSSKPPLAANWQGVRLDKGTVWLDFVDDAATISVTAFNSDAWKIGTIPCLGERERPPPEELSGTWRVTSVAILQGGQLDARSPTTWIGQRMELDVRARRAVLGLGQGAARRCTIGRSGARDPSESQTEGLGAWRAGLAPVNEASVFLDLECGSGSERYIERVDVLSDSALAIVGDDKYLLILKRSTQAALGQRRRLAKSGEACGANGLQCQRGHVCTATSGPSDTIVETCLPIE